MILVKVVKLIVDVDRCWDIAININHRLALGRRRATLVILINDTLNLLTHDIECDTEREENHSKDAKNDHCGAKGWHWSPRGQHLLLKLTLLQFLNFFLNTHQVFLRDFHNYIKVTSK